MHIFLACIVGFINGELISVILIFLLETIRDRNERR